MQCGIVEHLSDDLAPDARIALALDLNKRRDAILIEKEMVKGPLRRTYLLSRNRLLALN